jgi:hypothetical protein
MSYTALRAALLNNAKEVLVHTSKQDRRKMIYFEA